jgi:hypothetical protein
LLQASNCCKQAIAASKQAGILEVLVCLRFTAGLLVVPATPGNFKKVLKKGSVAVIVGGIAEMYMQVR